MRERLRKYRAANPEKVRKQKQKAWAGQLLWSARASSRKRGHAPPTITVEWIEAQVQRCPRCPFTGLPLIPPSKDEENAGKRSPWAPSLDRIDPNRGYTPDNVLVTSMFWNLYRGTLDIPTALANLRAAADCILNGTGEDPLRDD